MLDLPVAIAPGPAQASPATHRFRFHGEGGNFFLLILKNLFLTVFTLGIYAAWARTERRRYIWSNTEISGQRLVYTGTGKELFKGYLKVLACYAVLMFAPPLANLVVPGSQLILQIVLTIGFVALIPFAIYWSRAYLLSRTQWRGINFGMTKGAGSYAKTFVLGYLLTILTLGFYGPVWLNKMRSILINNARFGTEPLEYHGDDYQAFRIGVKGFLLTLVTLGIYHFWYAAEMSRFVLSNTYFMNARGRSELTAKDMFVIIVGSLLGTVFTLGLAFPWIVVWSTRKTFDRITFEGDVDFALVAQRARTGGAGGDALAHDLGVDLAL